MISIKALGMYSSDFSGGETRNGDTQIATDGKNFDVIDGGCDRYATRLSAYLKSINLRDPYLHISHCHYDHRDGIEKILSDPWFKPRGLYCQNPDSITGHSSAIRSDINALRKIIDKAKSKGIPVIYLGNEDKIEHGKIKITVYRQYPKYSGNSDAYLNDGSLCYWFAALRYLTTGDASMWCAYKYNLNPLIVKGGHHGNDMSADGYLKPSQMCPWLYKHGCRFYWDNDFSTKLTDFLMTGREDAVNAGMIFIDIHGDIDMVFAEGKVTIKHAGKTYTAEVPYQGKMLKASWEKGSKGMWYRYPDGSWATGWALIDKKWYYFDEDGWMLTGWRELQWSQSKKKNKKDWFFFEQKTGSMVTGWQVLVWSGGVSTFCFDENGVMLTGWHWLTKDGKTGWYYFENSGAMHTGWIFDDGAWYYLGADGKMVTGWVTYKGKKCYLEPKSDRTHVQGQCYVSRAAVIDGKSYKFDKDGYAEEIPAEIVAAATAPAIIKNAGFHPGRNCGQRTEKVQYIVIHYTGSEGTAANNVNYFNNGNRGASAHYFVDRSGEIREYCDPVAYYAWHCGGSLESSHHPLHNICTNRNSIGIEICTHNNGGTWEFTAAAVNAAITLTKYLMAKFGISADHVCRHYDVTGKACPRVPGWGVVGGTAEWDKFKAAIAVQPRELTDNEKFIEQIGAMARADMAKSGICAAVTVAQAILESGWGKSDLAIKAKNIFGMKCNLSGNTWPGSSWDGKSTYNKSTGEYYSGSYTTVKADFRVYKSWAESVADHSAYLAGARNGSALRYAGLAGCTDYRRAAQIIKNGGYATSPDYVTKICNIVEQYNLVRFNANYSAPAAKPAATVTPAPASKVPYLVRVGSGVQIYKAPAGAVAKTCPYGVYTIVEERNGYGKLKSGAGWLKLSAVAKV